MSPFLIDRQCIKTEVMVGRRAHRGKMYLRRSRLRCRSMHSLDWSTSIDLSQVGGAVGHRLVDGWMMPCLIPPVSARGRRGITMIPQEFDDEDRVQRLFAAMFAHSPRVTG